MDAMLLLGLLAGVALIALPIASMMIERSYRFRSWLWGADRAARWRQMERHPRRRRKYASAGAVWATASGGGDGGASPDACADGDADGD